ncbi:SusD/RagB family nutrient-binding outer membrane lipoprotein [Flavobacteriaceae bacterium KMM 6898]|nr:SusD/RagB family nutrient-binding outer membrane lipoprotein [Flavobacteriaceae bacterium KMM 6898]
MKQLFKIFCIATVLGASLLQSCETTELDLRKNPNALAADQGNPDFLLNGIQLSFTSLVESFGRTGAELTRIDYMFGRDYRNVYSPANFDGEWTLAYTQIRTDIKALTPLAEEAKLNYHLGMAQFIEAYTLISLVDMFGDIPFSEANLGSENFNPKLDSGADVYAAALVLIDDAIANFQDGGVADPQNDFFYDGDASKWIKACNTLKLKLYMTSRLANSGALASFNAIITSNNYISSTADDFQFQWGVNEVQPDTRHPRYSASYTTQGGTDYMSNHQIDYMNQNDDPRIRYYYYRQNENTPGSGTTPPALETLQCSLQTPPSHYTGFPFCSLSNGYWGRDHGSDEGTPPDGFLRSLTGVYPAGGRFDDSTFDGQSQGDGAGGNGITPMLLASWVDFWRAEAAMVNNNPVGARTFLLAGLAKSVAKVQSFGALDSSADLSTAPTAGDVSDHSVAIAAAFDADSTGGWNVLGQEFFTALYGNGIDGYNFYRRTGFPNNLQPSLEAQPGSFIRSVFYSANFVNNNSSVQQKADQNQQVFWDTNPASPTFPLSN